VCRASRIGARGRACSGDSLRIAPVRRWTFFCASESTNACNSQLAMSYRFQRSAPTYCADRGNCTRSLDVRRIMAISFELAFRRVVAAPQARARQPGKQTAIYSAHDPNLRVNSRGQRSTSARIVGIVRHRQLRIARVRRFRCAKNVQRLYWVQFEGYLPSKPDLATNTTRLGTPLSAASTSMLIPGFVRKTSQLNKAPTASILKS